MEESKEHPVGQKDTGNSPCQTSHDQLEESPEDGQVDANKTLRKMDIHIMPMITLLYLLCFLDRGNIGNARIQGMDVDLNLKGSEYNWALTVFFFTYCTFELPSNLLLKRIRPSIWLPTLMVAWGTVMTLMGTVQGYHGLLIARLFLGVTESGLYPGVAFYITTWYSREDAQFRQAIFFSAAGIAGAFSGLLAFAIANMDGVGGYAGWRWIFIIEGLLTVLVAISAYFLIYDGPQTAKFLTKQEKNWVLRRLEKQYSDNENEVFDTTEFKLKYVRAAFCDWQVYLSVLIFYSLGCPLYGISFFLPTIIKNLGYKSSIAQLLTVPPYVIGAALTVFSAWKSDRMGKRSPLLLFHIGCTAAGYMVCLVASAKDVPGVVYFGVFLTVMGLYPGLPGTVTWLSNNLAGSHKRAAGMAIQLGFGNLAGAMAANFYRSKDSPKFILGHSLELGFTVLGIIAAVTLRLSYQKANESRERILREQNIQYTAEERSELGDKALTFRYML